MDMMSLIDTFFKTDDLKALIHQAGQMLNCPMIAIDDAFQIQASYSPEKYTKTVIPGKLRPEFLAQVNETPEDL